MTDLEQLKAMLDLAEVPYEHRPGPGTTQAVTVRRLPTPQPFNDGDHLVVVSFSSDGCLLDMRAYE